jgi:hypothetical protein
MSRELRVGGRGIAVLALAAAALITTRGLVAAETKPTSKTLLDAASHYVATFVERFTNVVAEEHYIQDWKTNAGVLLVHRELKGDFLLTRPAPAAPWLAFRDVFEVDGEKVRDHDDRLTALFLKPAATAMEEVQAIALESARYNVSNVSRTINQPLFTMIFLQPGYHAKFAYSVEKLDKSVGPDVWILQYKETARPTIVRGTMNRDLPAKGRFWIDAQTGRVAKTEIQLEDNLQSAQLTTTFAADDRFQIDVPQEMREQYAVKGNGGKVTGVATYGRFRQFEITTTEETSPR